MVYAWLQANPTDEAIVLLDEIEVSFHPDWQIGITDDLVRWAPTAQFVLATHSYELCSGVTPASHSKRCAVSAPRFRKRFRQPVQYVTMVLSFPF